MKIIDYAKFLIKKIKKNILIKHDFKKPDGTPRKIIDSTVAKKYGWKSKINLDRGFEITYNDFLNKYKWKNI